MNSFIRLTNRVWSIYQNDGLGVLVDSVRDFLRVVLARIYYVCISKIRQYKYRIKFGGSTPEPYKIINIKTSSVTHRIFPYPGEYGTYIFGDDWDDYQSEKTLGYTPTSRNYVLMPLEESLFFATMKLWINGEVEWENTDWYELDIDRISKSKADKRKNKLQQLRSSIAESGYMSQRELSEKNTEMFTIQRTALLPHEHYEVEVGIGRNGDIFFIDGKHRFSIAKYEGINEIPVRVLIRHREWQELRDEVYTATSVSELSPEARSQLSHPDMQDVICEKLENATGQEN